jgi:hypothetical protein
MVGKAHCFLRKSALQLVLPMTNDSWRVMWRHDSTTWVSLYLAMWLPAVMLPWIASSMHAWCIWWRRDGCAHAAASSASTSHNSSELRRWTMIPTFRNKRYGYKNKGCFDNVSIRHSNATIYRQDSILMSSRSQMITTCFLPLSSTFVNPWLSVHEQSCDKLSIKRPL